MYLQNFKENGKHPDEMAGYQPPPLNRYSLVLLVDVMGLLVHAY